MSSKTLKLFAWEIFFRNDSFKNSSALVRVNGKSSEIANWIRGGRDTGPRTLTIDIKITMLERSNRCTLSARGREIHKQYHLMLFCKKTTMAGGEIKKVTATTLLWSVRVCIVYLIITPSVCKSKVVILAVTNSLFL